MEIPAAWQGKRVSLFLERAHGETRVWLDGRQQGTQNSVIAPQVFDLGVGLSPGKHRLTICTDNTRRLNLGPICSIRDEGTQTNWNGLLGKIELRAANTLGIEDVQVYPDVDRKLVKVRVTIANATGKEAAGFLTLVAGDQQSPSNTYSLGPAKSFTAGDARKTIEVELPLGEKVQLWDEFSPALYDLHVGLAADPDCKQRLDARRVTFGMRKLAVRGTQFVMNGRPIFLRGTLDCGIYPLTGYPPTDVPSWRRICGVAKSYGLNFIRFHSWCPPEAAFAAADLEGVMFQVEGPIANTDVGRDAKRDAFLQEEFLRMVHTYGNHPSFCLMTLGNEYGGSDKLLSSWIDMLIREDPRHLYASPSCGQLTTNRQYAEGSSRGIQGPGTAGDFRAEVARQDRPLTGHEIGQWTFYPNFEEMKKYTGVLAARNFALVRDDLAAKGMLDLAPQFFRATGSQAVLLYKEEIEVLLRTPGFPGFSLLDLHDYPGQGTSLIGLLDPFWDSKGFITPEAHRRYCGPTVPLVRLKKRVFTTEETLTAEAEAAHFGPTDLHDVVPMWSLQGDGPGRMTALSFLNSLDLPTGKLSPLCHIEASLAQVRAPCKLTLTLLLKWKRSADAAPELLASNEWDVWVYPAPRPIAVPKDVTVSRRWDDATKTALAAGKRVVLFAAGGPPARSLPGSFLPVFWSPVWFPQQINTMGILCDPKHPALAGFPTDPYSNWQWYELLQNSRSMILDGTPATFRPIVQVIDNFARNHKMGNVFEARVGPGRLLVCSIDLPRLADKEPAARQLLQSLYAYAGSEAMRPPQELSLAVLDKVLTPAIGQRMRRLGARVVQADSQAPGYEASHVLDGDPATIWHTPWQGAAPGFPHFLVIEFARPVAMRGLKMLPRQDMINGLIGSYEVFAGNDGKTWGRPVAKGAFPGDGEVKVIPFGGKVEARFLKFVALSSAQGQPFVAMADLEVIPADIEEP